MSSRIADTLGFPWRVRLLSRICVGLLLNNGTRSREHAFNYNFLYYPAPRPLAYTNHVFNTCPGAIIYYYVTIDDTRFRFSKRLHPLFSRWPKRGV